MVSLDGYFEGPNHDLSWHNVDEEFNQFAINQLHDTGMMLFGRRTYQLMEGYWPKVEEDPKTTPDDVQVASLMNNTPKMVISRTLNEVKEGPNWKNVTLRNKLDADEIKELKQQPGKDIWAGGSELATSLFKRRASRRGAFNGSSCCSWSWYSAVQGTGYKDEVRAYKDTAIQIRKRAAFLRTI
jgi:dihydrofolate reductase